MALEPEFFFRLFLCVICMIMNLKQNKFKHRICSTNSHLKCKIIWFTFNRYYSALGNTGLVTLTTPYLHAGQPNGRGAGVVITVARSLYRGESSHHHHTNDEVFGVMGADFSLTYFYRLAQNNACAFESNIPEFCQESFC